MFNELPSVFSLKLPRHWFAELKFKLSCCLSCDQFNINSCDEFGHTFVVLLKSDLEVQQTVLIFQSKASMAWVCLAAALVVTKFNINSCDEFGHTFVVLLKSDLEVQQTALSFQSKTSKALVR